MGIAPASASEAMDMVHAGLAYLATADATVMGADTQARGLHLLQRATSIATAARASILAAFTVGQGYCADADYSPRAWLINKTRVSKGAAVGYTAWVRRAAEHPEVFAALAAGQMSESYARMICLWTGKLAQECRAKADEILLGRRSAGRTCGIWPGSPRRSWPAPSRPTPTARTRCSRTGRSGWRPHSTAPGS